MVHKDKNIVLIPEVIHMNEYKEETTSNSILVPPYNSDHGKLDLESFINNDKSQPKKRDFI